MKIGASELWRWEGTIERGPYLLVGILGFALKHNLDRLVATVLFGRPWTVFNYWIAPTEALPISRLPRQDQLFFATLLVLALPFIWVGLVLTLKRLRAVGLPTWLVLLFFLPVINLAFFALLCVLPSRPGPDLRRPPRGGRIRAFLDRLIPDHPAGGAALSLIVTVPFGLAATVLGTSFLSNYGWGMFVALPFCLGLASVLLYGYHRPPALRSCLAVACLSTVLLGLALLALAIEGVICLVMALPLGLLLAAMGGAVGCVIQLRPWSRDQAPATLLVLLVFLPGLMGAESLNPREAPLLVVRTTAEIDATPAHVWQHVVSFAELGEPEEWLFRLGIAYPMRAEIQGHGVGAVRHCVFSTGSFVEPIEVWEEPRRLSFSVTFNPPPMQEWTPYREIQPPHLNDFLVSHGGQFLLTPLSDARTELEATTWYQHHMWPATYWQLWSDWIIHRIHRRVLQHIQQLTEGDPNHQARRAE